MPPDCWFIDGGLTVTATYAYDAQNRLTAIAYADGSPGVDLSYDTGAGSHLSGRLASVADSAGERLFSYDANGYPEYEQRIIADVTYLTEYDFDPAGNLRAVVYPTGQVVEYLPQAADVGRIGRVRLNAGSGFAPLAQSIAYKPFGPLSAMTLGNGITQAKGFDQNYQIAAITAGTVMSRTYTPDNAGNIAAITDHLSPGRSQSFGYDARNQLTGATGIYGTLGFSYDHTGNRRTATDNGAQELYAYAAGTNRLDAITGSRTINFDHDSRGNLTGRTIISGSAPPASANPEYTYTYDGQRITKTLDGQTTVYHYDLSGQLIAETTADGTPIKAYVWLDGQPLAQVAADNAVYYYHNDHLGTPQRLTDATGTLVWSADYLPFGQADVTLATIENNLRFSGQYFDSETGLHYNYHRYYDPSLGRYLRADPIGLEGGINPYLYVQNDPVNLVDPYGLWSASGHTDLTTRAMLALGFSKRDINIVVNANVNVDRTSNQFNNAAHFMPGTSNQAPALIIETFIESVRLGQNNQYDLALARLGEALHTAQDYWSHQKENAGWIEHLPFLGTDPDNSSLYNINYGGAFGDSLEWLRKFKNAMDGCK